MISAVFSFSSSDTKDVDADVDACTEFPSPGALYLVWYQFSLDVLVLQVLYAHITISIIVAILIAILIAIIITITIEDDGHDVPHSENRFKPRMIPRGIKQNLDATIRIGLFGQGMYAFSLSHSFPYVGFLFVGGREVVLWVAHSVFFHFKPWYYDECYHLFLVRILFMTG